MRCLLVFILKMLLYETDFVLMVNFYQKNLSAVEFKIQVLKLVSNTLKTHQGAVDGIDAQRSKIGA